MQKFTLVLFLFSVAFSLAGELRCLRPGAPVISRYKDNRYFPGRVDGLGESIDVTFENGQQQTYSSFSNEVIVDDLPDVNELIGGSRVLARRPSSTSYEPGFVNGSIEGLPLNDTFLVNFDNGDSIARNIRDIRLAVKPRSCMNEKGIYIGCFENVINSFLTNYYPVNPTDVATCNWACFTRGFRFAGLQNGTWCFCGNHVNDSLKVDDNDCNMACRDSRADVCGGFQRMTVYWTGADFDDNSTNEFSDGISDDSRGLSSDVAKSRSSEESACADLYDSTQCNTWADQSKCIENPDWMIANCKRSCYACGYDEHTENNIDKVDSNLETSALYQARPNYDSSPPAYQSYDARNPYSATSSDASTQSSSYSKSSTVDNLSTNTPGYLGCFRDSPNSRDLEYLADIRPLSIRACVTKCKSMRFPYAGVQSSSSCYCGLQYGRYGQLEHEDCDTPCEADATEMCGGISKNSLYHTGFPVKFSAAPSLTRKEISPSPQINVASNGRSPSNSYNTNTAQYTGVFYPQQSYPPPVQPRPASPYAQYPNQPSYQQTQVYQPAYNRYQPSTYGYNNQPGGFARPYGTGSDTGDYSPRDSSSYRWRETFVKLRQQEQERFSKPSLRNLRKHSRTWRKSPGNSVNMANSRKAQDWARRNNSRKATDITNGLSQSLYKQIMSRWKNSTGKAIRSSRKKGSRRKYSKRLRKNLSHPGVFLRKKASKKNSFLAFLPHEVTEDESLLRNVYNMLSIMLRNLKKHRRTSMKNLKKYLKFPEIKEVSSEVKVPVRGQPQKQHDSRSPKRNQGLDPEERVGKRKAGKLHSHQKNFSSSDGQKQLSNKSETASQRKTHTTHLQSLDNDTEQSLLGTGNKNSVGSQNARDLKKIRDAERRNGKGGNGIKTKNEPSAIVSLHRIASSLRKSGAPVSNDRLNTTTVSSTAFNRSKSNVASQAGLMDGNVFKHITKTSNHSSEDRGKLTKMEEKTFAVRKEHKNRSNNTVEKSNDEIISTIVDMLENEKDLRKMQQSSDEHDERKRNEISGGKPLKSNEKNIEETGDGKRKNRKRKKRKREKRKRKNKKREKRKRKNKKRKNYKDIEGKETIENGKQNEGTRMPLRKAMNDEDNLMKENEEFQENERPQSE